jgi:hypothetical protein
MQDGSVQMMRETRTTEGRKMYWQAGAWLLERTATDIFGRARVWKDAEPPKPGEGGEPAEEEGADAFEAAWNAYMAGRRDERDESSSGRVEDPGANGASSV